jgi:hypothetical protein
MLNTKTIKISKEFSVTPKGREYPKDGEFTGDKFRKEFIEPIFDQYDKIIINLDDLYGCPSSFREEAFGGLARIYSPEKVLAKLEFVCTDEPPLVDTIINDIKHAKV